MSSPIDAILDEIILLLNNIVDASTVERYFQPPTHWPEDKISGDQVAIAVWHVESEVELQEWRQLQSASSFTIQLTNRDRDEEYIRTKMSEAILLLDSNPRLSETVDYSFVAGHFIDINKMSDLSDKAYVGSIVFSTVNLGSGS